MRAKMVMISRLVVCLFHGEARVLDELRRAMLLAEYKRASRNRKARRKQQVEVG